MHGHEEVRKLRTRPARHPVPVLVALGLVTVLVASACTGDSGSDANPSGGRSETIPQPPVGNVPVAPESERVDITMPSFSDPTNVTNPLFPVSQQESVLLLGHVDGKPFRTEVTLLPYTRIIEWQGLRVETLVSQYVAYLDERIQEVAYDWYAQADDGSVWYFGEDVFDFRNGAIVVTEGTWLAGKDGPAAMIMPGDPHVGDVYRTENAPGFVFEEVTVTSVNETLDGPLGPIEGGMLADELHSDGKIEQKIFAPGYGEFLTGGGGDLEALALAVPTDSLPGALPPELTVLSGGALDVFDAAGSGEWKAASATVTDMSAAWENYESDRVPRLIEPRMTRALEALAAAVDARDAAEARNAAIEAARWSFDLQLPYRPAAEIDLARLDLWAAQLLVDAATGDPAAVNADAFALDYVRDRILHALDNSDLTRVNTELGAIQVAVADQDLPAAADAAGRLRGILAGVDSVS
jgi:hypothetical protein